MTLQRSLDVRKRVFLGVEGQHCFEVKLAMFLLLFLAIVLSGPATGQERQENISANQSQGNLPENRGGSLEALW